MIRIKSDFVILLAGIIFLTAPTSVSHGQDSSSVRTDRILKFLKRIDRNGNEILEPSEMAGQASSYLQGLGFDTTKPLSLSKVMRKFEKKDSKKTSKKEDKGRIVSKVPGFGVESEDGEEGIGRFGSGEESGSAVDLEAKYGKRVMELVNRTLSGYDKNKNEILDPDEIKKANWGKPSPRESDKNRDGVLTKIELAERYLARERDSSRSSSRSNSPSRSKRSVSSSSSSSKSSSSTRSSSPSSTSRRGSPIRRTPSSTPSKSAYNSGNDRYARYAKGLMTQYDANKDGKLDKAELGKMRRPPKDADVNRDGFVTSEELTSVLSGNSKPSPKTVVQTSQPSQPSVERARRENENRLKSYRGSRSSSSRSRRSGGSFSSLDTNLDGQIQMFEFAQEWDSDVYSEFRQKDSNGDGIITSEEWNGG